MPGKVLIVDDDPEIVDAMTNLLDAKGYQVVSEKPIRPDKLLKIVADNIKQ
ncbi:MAG TPA: hypothetical protein VLH60_08135 [Sedimentisphaerales bacterium]|nr:hypothetical protein [Sedimentisphaerales bacterium]